MAVWAIMRGGKRPGRGGGKKRGGALPRMAERCAKTKKKTRCSGFWGEPNCPERRKVLTVKLPPAHKPPRLKLSKRRRPGQKFTARDEGPSLRRGGEANGENAMTASYAEGKGARQKRLISRFQCSRGETLGPWPKIFGGLL